MKFRWQDQEFPAVAKPIFEEIDSAERLVRQPMDEWSRSTSVRVGIFWSIRRVNPQLLSWEELGKLEPDAFDVIHEPESPGGDVDPPAPTPSDSPDGPAVVAGSSPTAGGPTSST